MPLIGGARDLGIGADGQVFTALSPTPGTGIIGHAAPTTFDTTKPYLLIHNPIGSGKLLSPLYLRLTVTVVSVGNTLMQFTQVVDPGTAAGLSRYSSGGTQIVPKNPNMASTNTAAGLVYAGAVVATAANAGSRTVGHQPYRTVIGVVGDVYQFSWACPIMGDPASLITTGTAVSNVAFGYAPVSIGPGQSFLVYQWAASQSTGPTFEVECGFLEVPW